MKKLFPEVAKRIYENVWVCRRCKSKIRALLSHVRQGKVRCRRCGSKALRPKRKERASKV